MLKRGNTISDHDLSRHQEWLAERQIALDGVRNELPDGFTIVYKSGYYSLVDPDNNIHNRIFCGLPVGARMPSDEGLLELLESAESLAVYKQVGETQLPGYKMMAAQYEANMRDPAYLRRHRVGKLVVALVGIIIVSALIGLASIGISTIFALWTWIIR